LGQNGIDEGGWTRLFGRGFPTAIASFRSGRFRVRRVSDPRFTENILPGKQWSITGITLLLLAAFAMPVRSIVYPLLFSHPFGNVF
jgi:hypothetical protein